MKGKPDYNGTFGGCVTANIFAAGFGGILKADFFLMTLDFLRNFSTDAIPSVRAQNNLRKSIHRNGFRLIFEPYLRPPLSNNPAFNWP